TSDLVDSVLDGAAKFAGEVWGPLNASGDEEGLKWHDGEVTTPKGFIDVERLEHGVLDGPAADARCDRGRAAARQRRAEADLPAQDGVGRMDRHDEPDRAASRV